LKQKEVWLYILALLCLNPIFGQSQILPVLKKDFLNSLQVGLGLGNKILDNSKKEAGILLALGGLSFLDESTNQFFQRNHSSLNDAFFRIDRIYGEKNILIPTSALIYGMGLVSKNLALRKVGLKSTQAIFYSGFIAVCIKELIGRTRPYQQMGPYRFRPLSFKERWRSFPSGHATIAFAFSTIMAEAVSNVFWQSFWYSGAFLVSAGRMYHNAHWFTDMLAGSLIGWSVAKYVWQYPNDASTQKQVNLWPDFSIFPHPAASLNLRFNF